MTQWKPLNPAACENLHRSNPDRVVRVVRESRHGFDTAAVTPEEFGLDADDFTALGFSVVDSGASRSRSFTCVAYFVRC